VLGEMRELGDGSDAFHAGLADAVAAAGVDRAILVGDAMAALADALPRRITTIRAASATDAFALLDKALAANDVVLIKGSNSVGLGSLVARLRKAAA